MDAVADPGGARTSPEGVNPAARAADKVSMRRRASGLLTAVLVGIAAFAVLPGPALASKAITHNASHVRLRVDRSGVALVEYTSANGRRHHTLAWGAKNAIRPTRGRKQRHFKVDYSGGYGTFGRAYWKTMKNACVHFPTAQGLADAAGEDPLPLYVAGCELPNGSFWALQAWKRIVPHGGLHKKDYRNAFVELHLSHWNTALPVLKLHTDWIYNGHFDHLWGQFTYLGIPVHGFGATNTGNPTDSFGRNLYVDTLDSRWGSGWWRLQAFLMHRAGRQLWDGSTYKFGHSTPGMATMYRGTIMGPGVARRSCGLRCPSPVPTTRLRMPSRIRSRRRWLRPATPATTRTDAGTGAQYHRPVTLRLLAEVAWQPIGIAAPTALEGIPAGRAAAG